MFKTGFNLQIQRDDLEEAVTEFLNKRVLPEFQIERLKIIKVEGTGDAAQYTFEATPVQASVVEPKP